MFGLKIPTQILGLACAVLAFSILPSAASDAFLKLGKNTSIPIGHYEFCKKHSAECNLKTRKDLRIKLTEKKWDTLLNVNYEVNQAIHPIEDIDQYGVEEHWAYNPTAGDCEEYVLMKRKKLIAKGWPAHTLLITVAHRKSGEGHAVLIVRTDQGDLVLDNVIDEVLLWNQTPHTLVKTQSPKHTGKWKDIVS